MKTPAERIERRIDSLKNSKISEENKKLILAFVQSLRREGIRELRQLKVIGNMEKIALWIEKDFREFTKKDIEKLMDILREPNYKGKKYKENTIWSFGVMIKRFWKWLEGKNERYPTKVSWIKVKKCGRIVPPEALITREDFKKMLNSCDHDGERCFIAVLYESGARVNELLKARIKDLDFSNPMVGLYVEGSKNYQKRRIPLYESVPYITKWLESHPSRNKPDSSLFVNYFYSKGQPWQRDTVYKLMNRLEKRLGNSKHLFPHLFRHSRATELATKITEQNMNPFFGWASGSRMPSIYVHLSGRDVDNAIAKVYGLENGSEKIEEKLTPKSCPRCKEKALPHATLCLNCGLPLTPEEMMKQGDSKDRITRIIEEIIENKLKEKLENEKISSFPV